MEVFIRQRKRYQSHPNRNCAMQCVMLGLIRHLPFIWTEKFIGLKPTQKDHQVRGIKQVGIFVIVTTHRQDALAIGVLELKCHFVQKLGESLLPQKKWHTRAECQKLKLRVMLS